MKYILIFGVILQSVLYVYKNQEEDEAFYVFKCMVYLFISTIHSVIIMIKIPLGACLMSAVYLIDKENRRIKLRLIASGITIVILSSLNYQDLGAPLQKLYIYNIKSNVSHIDVYTNNDINNRFLFSINNRNDILNWVNVLKSSSSFTLWNSKVLPQNHGYLIKLHYPNKVLPIIVTPFSPNLPNIFIGDHYISYTNDMLPDLINTHFNIKPVALKVGPDNIEIKTSSIITDLWEELLWSRLLSTTSVNISASEIKGKLILDKNSELEISFSSNFHYAQLSDRHIIKLSEHLSNKLNEQYILSGLDIVNAFSEYSPAHIHTPPSTIMKYSIELDESRRYYGLYENNEIKNTKTLLHNVSSENSAFFVLRNPYILLLDERDPSQYYLMLINQNIPNKHRYIEKDKVIIPSSIAICPQNSRFTYTVNNDDSSTLYLVNNYYEKPSIVATGDILDSLFLSERYIAFSLLIDNTSLLCIYDISLGKTIKYITIPGNIYMVKVENNSIIFSVQSEDNTILKEGIFALDTSLQIKKIS